MPFLIKGKSKRVGLLLIHGYMSVPAQVRELADYLSSKGVWVYAPRLRGHGTSPEDLAIRTHKDWILSAEAGYALISNICAGVIIGGFSTGGALALHLAARMNDVQGVFAICPPLRLQDVAAKFAPAVDAWNRLMNMVNMGGIKKEFVENKPETPHLNYFRNPISGVREIELLMETLEPELPFIHAPALVAQSQRDPVVNPKGSRLLFDHLGSEDKRYVLFNCNRHCIIVGRGASRVHRAIGDFVEYLASRKGR
jgi:esterase/lipase